jgi:hypothetical protein
VGTRRNGADPGVERRQHHRDCHEHEHGHHKTSEADAGQQLARHGAELLAARLQLVEDLRPYVGKAYETVARGASRDDAELEYRSSVPTDGPLDEALLAGIDMEMVSRLYAAHLPRLVNEGKVLAEIPLPICGLLSDLDGETVADKLDEMISILRTMGCEVPSPNITLSFITLIFIPCFGITDQGLFDVREFKIIDPIISLG